MIDITQRGRKLKHPKIRHWFHPKKGSDYFHQWAGTKARLLEATKQSGDWTVAYKGKQYSPKEFLKKFPKFKFKK